MKENEKREIFKVNWIPPLNSSDFIGKVRSIRIVKIKDEKKENN